MLSREKTQSREQIEMISIGDLVPKDHMLRDIDRAINFDFIYDLVKDLYSADNGRPSIDPVVLFKMIFVKYLFGIRSIRQTIKEIEVNMAYRWFLGYGMTEKMPHFTTFGKNYERRFANSDVFEKIFEHILLEAVRCKFVDASAVFIDATHIKASANKRKAVNEAVRVCANCPSCNQCTKSKNHQKVVNRHVWEDFMEFAEDVRLSPEGKAIYSLRGQTIERVFADAKEKHFMRYTYYRGLAKLRMQALLTFAAMNLKKLAKWKRVKRAFSRPCK